MRFFINNTTWGLRRLVIHHLTPGADRAESLIHSRTTLHHAESIGFNCFYCQGSLKVIRTSRDAAFAATDCPAFFVPFCIFPDTFALISFSPNAFWFWLRFSASYRFRTHCRRLVQVPCKSRLYQFRLRLQSAILPNRYILNFGNLFPGVMLVNGTARSSCFSTGRSKQ